MTNYGQPEHEEGSEQVAGEQKGELSKNLIGSRIGSEERYKKTIAI